MQRMGIGIGPLKKMTEAIGGGNGTEENISRVFDKEDFYGNGSFFIGFVENGDVEFKITIKLK